MTNQQFQIIPNVLNKCPFPCMRVFIRYGCLFNFWSLKRVLIVCGSLRDAGHWIEFLRYVTKKFLICFLIIKPCLSNQIIFNESITMHDWETLRSLRYNWGIVQKRCSKDKFIKFTEKYLCWSLFLTMYFPMSLVKFLKSQFYKTPPRECHWSVQWFLFGYYW